MVKQREVFHFAGNSKGDKQDKNWIIPRWKLHPNYSMQQLNYTTHHLSANNCIYINIDVYKRQTLHCTAFTSVGIRVTLQRFSEWTCFQVPITFTTKTILFIYATVIVLGHEQHRNELSSLKHLVHLQMQVNTYATCLSVVGC